MARLKVGNGNARLNVSGKTSYKVASGSTKVVSTQNNTKVSAGNTDISLNIAANPVQYHQPVNVPRQVVSGFNSCSTTPTTSSTQKNPWYYFNQVTLVPADAETTICSYAMSRATYIQGFQACGDADATYKLYVDDDVVAVVRTTTANLNAYLDLLNGTPVCQAGKTVKVTVTCTIGGVTFMGTMMGYYNTTS